MGHPQIRVLLEALIKIELFGDRPWAHVTHPETYVLLEAFIKIDLCGSWPGPSQKSPWEAEGYKLARARLRARPAQGFLTQIQGFHENRAVL